MTHDICVSMELLVHADSSYKSAEKNAKALQQKMANVEQYVGKDNSHDRDQQQISTEHNTGRT